MSEEYGPNIITLTDDEGNQYELEHIETIEFNNKFYVALMPLDDGEQEEEDMGLILLRVEHVDGEDLLSDIEDEEEAEAVYNELMELLFEEEGEE